MPVGQTNRRGRPPRECWVRRRRVTSREAAKAQPTIKGKRSDASKAHALSTAGHKTRLPPRQHEVR